MNWLHVFGLYSLSHLMVAGLICVIDVSIDKGFSVYALLDAAIIFLVTPWIIGIGCIALGTRQARKNPQRARTVQRVPVLLTGIAAPILWLVCLFLCRRMSVFLAIIPIIIFGACVTYFTTFFYKRAD